MKTKPRIFVSVPDDRHLDNRRYTLKRAIIKYIAKQGFQPAGFEPEQFGVPGLQMNLKVWNIEGARKLISRCDGILVLALARTILSMGGYENKVILLPTPYNHLEGALAMAQQLPAFILFEETMEKTGIFSSDVRNTSIPALADKQWVKEKAFQQHFEAWSNEVRERRDVFLGYCSKANSTAIEIRDFLEESGFSIVDWARDFKTAGVFILDEIEKASARCRCAIFLFTKDDELETIATGTATAEAVPRDNVLLEAGYFTQARGKERVAIIREKGAKMPADLGGIVYLSLEDKSNLEYIKKGLVDFLTSTL